MEFYVVFLIAFVMAALTYGNPVIQPSPVVVTEGTNATFNCTYQHQGTILLYVYRGSTADNDRYVGYFDGCHIIFSKPNVLHVCSDVGNTLTITITLTTENYNHGQSWFCGLSVSSVTVKTSIYVNVPVTDANVTPSTNGAVDVVERVSFEFRCQSKGRPRAVIEWFKQTGSFSEIPIIAGFRYSTSSDDTQIESILKFVSTKEDNGYRIYCKAYNNISDSIVVSKYKPLLNVLYPPITPIIKYKQDNGNEVTVQHITMIDQHKITFTCYSDSNPATRYSWSTGQSDGQAMVEVVVHKDLTEITCTATNEMKPSNSGQQTGTNSSYIGVTILYPPTAPALTYAATTNSSTILHTITTTIIHVVSGDTLSIECTADGNPVPIYNWSHQGQSFQADPVMKIVNVQSDDYTKYTCTASNVMDPTFSHKMHSFSSANVLLNILYGPTTPEIYYEDVNGLKPIMTPLAVIEHTSFNVKCESTSNPMVNEYKWQGQPGQHLAIRNISAGDPSIYTCDVTNVMSRTYGEKVIGRNFTTLTVDVLYPPDVQYLPSMTLEEGNMLNITCAVSKGNPHSNVVFRWFDTFGVISSTAVLEIHNVTRNHSGMYACLVYNSLQPTFGRKENGSDIESFNLDVFYKASITQFYTERNGDIYTNITINETDAFNVLCSVDSNPNSNIIITRDGQRIANGTNIVNINRFVEYAACEDAGIYTCTGYNPHIQDQSRDTADIIVTVMCYTRATKPVENITAAAQSDIVHFNATFMAYPIPGEEGYIWRKQQSDSAWLVLTSNDRIIISTGYLKTYLTIHEIRPSDYGNYSLTVSNNVGKEYEQIFELIPYEPPGEPKTIRVVVQNKDVRISWLPGFNGGFDQTFVIQLKTDVHPWFNASFEMKHNTSNKHTYTTLEGLDLDTRYYVRMFAYNILDRSDYVPDPPFSMTILADPISPTSSTNTAAIVGETIGGILTLTDGVVCTVLHVTYPISLASSTNTAARVGGTIDGILVVAVIVVVIVLYVTDPISPTSSSTNKAAMVGGTIGGIIVAVIVVVIMLYVTDRISPTSPSINTPAIVGGTIGGIIVVVIVLIAVVIVQRRAKPGSWIFCKRKPTKADHVYYNTAIARNEVIEGSFRTERRTRPAVIETSSSTDDINTYEHMIATTNPEEKVYSELKHDGADGTDDEVQADQSNIYINLRINGTHE